MNRRRSDTRQDAASSQQAGSRWLVALVLAAALAAPEASAVEFELGGSGVQVELKTEMSVGARLRMQEPSANVLGKLNVEGQQHLCDNGACTGVAGNARFLAAPGNVLPDYDNGDLNYHKHDVVQAVSRFSERLGIHYNDYGFFTRGVFWYDPVNASFEETHPNTAFQPAHTRRPGAAVDVIGKRFELMEAYAYGSLPLPAGKQLDVRAGNQLVYWGESNFLVLNSLNVFNPPSANRAVFAGGNLDEAFTPLPLLQLKTQLLDGLNLELLYEFGWKPVELEPAGTYFSTDDTVGAGARYAQLDGKLPEDPMNQVRPVPTALSNSGRTFYRDPDREPSGGGQYGTSLKYFAPGLGEGTTFGLYYANYHNRLPVGSFTAARESSCRQAPTALDATPLGAGVLPYCLAGEPVPVDSIRYFLEYPEDVRMVGASAVTTHGVWSFQAEYAYRPNLPVQVDTVDLTFAALQPAFPRQDVVIPGVATIPGARHAVPDYVETRYRGHTVQAGEYIRGYERMKVGQLNLSTILLTPNNPFGASQILLLMEAGLTHVLDFPSLNQLQLEGPGTSNHYSAGIDGTGANGQTDPDRANVTQQTHGFATQYNYGYRLYSELEYPDALLGLTLKPLLAVAHDVHGTAVGNGGNFIEGRKQFDLGLIVKTTQRWTGLLQYTCYTGAGEFNLLSDRDNLALSLTLNF